MKKIVSVLKKIVFVLLPVGILYFAGCAMPVFSDNGNVVTPTNTSALPSVTVTSTPTPLPTATPTPLPTATPTPTEVPVYEQILQYEAENEPELSLAANTALLVNMTKQEVLYAKHATEVIYPASVTKLMTAYVVFSQEEDLTKTVEISQNATISLISGSKMCGFYAGDRILFRDLLGCMLVYSGNDTAVAVAEQISGSEEAFVALMNQKAEELGLKNSCFCNSHGLPDDNHVTSAYDIYLIMENLFPFDEFLDIIGLGSIKVDVLRNDTLKTVSFTSTNQFLSGSYQIPDGLTLLGGKTGTTKKAGCCLSIYVLDQNGDCYIAEIFGAESYEGLYTSMIQLLQTISDQ